MSMIGINMLALVFMLFLAQNVFTGANETEEWCTKKAAEACPQMKVKLTFPGTVEELNALCPEVIKRTECLHKHDEMCPEAPGAPFTPEQYNTFQSLIGDVCNENSLLHRVISESIGCIRPTVLNTTENLFDSRRQLRQAYIRYREAAGAATESGSPEERQRYRCLNHFQDISLLLAKIAEQCGIMAKSAVREVIIRSTFLKEQHCAKELVPVLQNLIDILELPTELRSRMSELMTAYASWED